jgi:nitroreductase
VPERAIIDQVAKNLYKTPSKNGWYNWRCKILKNDDAELKDKIYKLSFRQRHFGTEANAIAQMREKLDSGLRPVGPYNTQLLAPYLLIFTNHDPRKRQPKVDDIEIGMAVWNAITTAVSLGLATSLCDCFYRERLEELLKLKKGTFKMILSLGYADKLKDVSLQDTEVTCPVTALPTYNKKPIYQRPKDLVSYLST